MIQILYLFFFALLLAALEVQIEGKDGWAANLPTWRPQSSKWYSRLYKRITWGKDLTGYHLLVLLLVLSFLHFPYAVSGNWSWSSELATLSFLFLVIVVEDFLWFVINPDYGLSRFRKEFIGWHKKWFLFLPADYWLGLIVAALLYGFSFVR
ncbi:MAG: hypothetical protein Q7S70_00930 [bacterium]|nr:hypothetical protein [bacterium]